MACVPQTSKLPTQRKAMLYENEAGVNVNAAVVILSSGHDSRPSLLYIPRVDRNHIFRLQAPSYIGPITHARSSECIV